MSALASRFSSPRFQRKLLWIATPVLVAGVTAAIVTTVWTSPHVAPPLPPPGKVQVPVVEKSVPVENAAKLVGERFIRTAVERTNLAESWKLTAPALREDFTLARWKSGNIPVVPYPADLSKPAPVRVEYSYKDRLLLLILLNPRPGDPTKPQLFHLGLHAFGTGANRHWLVDYWAPFGSARVPIG
jgi:hypothetical protein